MSQLTPVDRVLALSAICNKLRFYPHVLSLNHLVEYSVVLHFGSCLGGYIVSPCMIFQVERQALACAGRMCALSICSCGVHTQLEVRR